jgi:hypothetical protein
MTDIAEEMERFWRKCVVISPVPNFIVANNAKGRIVKHWKGRKFIVKQSFIEMWRDYSQRRQAKS